jgi:hypothetical protein
MYGKKGGEEPSPDEEMRETRPEKTEKKNTGKEREIEDKKTR